MPDGMENPPRDANLPPGFDEEDPYADEDLDEYPEWWRRNIDEFRDHGMRPYRPPRFVDGGLVPEAVIECEGDLNVTIQIRAVNPEVNENWEVWVDGNCATTVGRHRDGDGSTVYEIDEESFRDIVHDATSTG